MQVLYLHPAKQGVEYDARGPDMGRPYGLIPVGAAALVNVLRENGIGVAGANYPLERRLNPGFELRHWLGRYPGARVVMIDLHWYEHAYGAISLAEACKAAMPYAWTVLGGLTASAFAREILESHPEVDYIIRGDAERPLLELVQQILRGGGRGTDGQDLSAIPNLSYRRDGGIMENERVYCATTADLDRLNFVDISFLEHSEQYHAHEYIVVDMERARKALETDPYRGRWICTARGCRYNCSYCGGCKSAHRTLAGRNGIVIRSPGMVHEDLVRLYEQGVHQASLSYDISELGDAYWQELFRLNRESGLKIGLYNELFQLPKPEFIRAYARNCDREHSCVALSPLSGSEGVRRKNGKFFSNEELFETLTLMNLFNMPVVVYFSLNLPGEDERAMEESVDLARSICDFYPSSLLRILTSCHTVDPHAPMNVHPERYNVTVNMRTFADYYEYCRNTQLSGPEARTELHRGFQPDDTWTRSLETMADVWERGRVGHERNWWPVPPGW